MYKSFNSLRTNYLIKPTTTTTTTTTTIKILQHNVSAWTKTRRLELREYYVNENPEIILLNSTGKNRHSDQVKIPNYKTYEKNYRNEDKAGVVVGVRNDWRPKCEILNDFQDDILGVRIKLRGVEKEDDDDDIIILTYYSPPRRDNLSLEEMRNYFEMEYNPVYLIGDLNARHPKLFGHHDSNDKGKKIQRYIDEKILEHLGPNFATLKSHQRFEDSGGGGRPDVVLGNCRHYHANDNVKVDVIKGASTTSDHLPVIVKIIQKNL